ncbi:hypothetical protein JI752_011005 [Lysobacter sp. MMG2]|uniref:hypothetical protein n=1 Tax=Lysobacter sp. MMG2 TaxID=2801338 RepID=UPI001C238DFE|nr:hypothetical protein [Lysobacter sp. MMG2]MBU8976669.1 hypothetical protein [Lysobacter sp. MMG2]
MPDTERTTPPADWSGAFAALPVETPPDGGWQRLQQALDAPVAHTQRRRHWPVWLAAAAIGAIALVPALRHSDDAVAPGDAPIAAHKRAPVDTSRPPIATSKRPETRVATTTEPTQAPSRDDGAAASTKPAAPDTAPRIAATTPPSPAPDAQAAELRAGIAALQSESAQLETLLALARDDRVASANGAALAVEFDRRIGRIDASLSQPGLADADRAALWQARVATMRELAGIETTQRWLFASGERYDGALVSVD